MELKKVVDSGNEFYTYKTDDFVTIRINFLFFLPNADYKTVLTASLLGEYLLKTNPCYKTFKEIEDKQKEYYNSYVDIYVDRCLNETFLSVDLMCLDQTYIGDNYFNSFLEFANKILFNPNFKNGFLDKNIFETIKKDRINDLNIQLSNPKNLSKRIFLNTVFPDTILSRGSFTNLEDYKKVIDSITDKDIIDIYNKIIKENYYKGYAFGNLTDNDINQIKSLFTFTPCDKKPNYYKKLDIKSGEKEITDEHSNESSICVVYEIKECKINNRYKYGILSNMLNGATGLCYEILRNKLGVCYYAGAEVYSTLGYLYITAEISKENKEKCISGIDEIIASLKDKDKITELFNFVIDKHNQNDYLSDELFSENINDLEDYLYERRISREEEHELVNNLKVEDIINEIDNIEKKYTFFFKGDKNEK